MNRRLGIAGLSALALLAPLGALAQGTGTQEGRLPPPPVNGFGGQGGPAGGPMRPGMPAPVGLAGVTAGQLGALLDLTEEQKARLGELLRAFRKSRRGEDEEGQKGRGEQELRKAVVAILGGEKAARLDTALKALQAIRMAGGPLSVVLELRLTDAQIERLAALVSRRRDEPTGEGGAPEARRNELRRRVLEVLTEAQRDVFEISSMRPRMGGPGGGYL